jgi:hypothetical protein
MGAANIRVELVSDRIACSRESFGDKKGISP